MPITYNGVGTRYYGRSKVEQRVGVCRSCGRQTSLTSYDTRLWFVILFIPIIPMGRKRIIDDCASCRRHYVLELDKWETAKQLDISGAREKFRTDPSGEHAIEVHQTLINYHEMTEAAEFRKLIQQQFADNARVNAYLGVILSKLNNLTEAAPYFRRAHELRPDLPEARIGIALEHMRAGKLDEARGLLDFLEKPGAAQMHSLESLELLANAYQKVARHQDALDLYKILVDAFPAVAQDKNFRKKIKLSEKALKNPGTLLPKRKFSWRGLLPQRSAPPVVGGPAVSKGGLIAIAVVVAGIALAFLIGNESIRRHRKIHLINAFDQPAEVEISGVGKTKVGPQLQTIEIPEGKYHVAITGPVREEFDITVGSSYFSRWTGDPFWGVNVGGAAILLFQRATYSAQPSPPSNEFFYGQRFVQLVNVTHPFTPLPDSVRIGRNETKTLTHVERFREPLVSLFQYFAESQRIPEALKLAEWSLELKPDDRSTLEQYIEAGGKSGETNRIQKYLAAGLDRRPVHVEWHRAYQNLYQHRRDNSELVGRYDLMVSAEPTNASLAYLRGRLCKTRPESTAWFEKARQLDPRNPFPNFALGYDRMSCGDWLEARKYFSDAVNSQPNDEAFSAGLALARFALGDLEALTTEGRSQVARSPMDLAPMVRLVFVLVARGQQREAEAVEAEFERRTMMAYREKSATINMASRCFLYYAVGNFAEMEKTARADKSGSSRSFLLQALVEQTNLKEAEKILLSETRGDPDPFGDLLMSVAWRGVGNLERSEFWWRKAVEALRLADADAVRAADLLQSPTPPTPAELDAVVMQPSAKATLVTALAMKHPTRAVEYTSLARKLNVELGYPSHLLKRIHNTIAPR